MSDLLLRVLSLRYSSWSMRPWLALTAAAAPFSVETIEIEDLAAQGVDTGVGLTAISKEQLKRRRGQGSVTGLFPVLYVGGTPIHESLAICEWAADAFPEAGLWPEDALDRARARAVCCEMVAGFQELRTNMSCNVFARVPRKARSVAIDRDIRRVFEIWRECLDRSSGPFLFGKFGIADCMYFPVLTRFRTYDVELDPGLEAYAREVDAHDAVGQWLKVALEAPSIPAYDQAMLALGGDPDAGRPSA